MTAIPQPASRRLISDRLRSPLRQVARRQWVVLATVGILRTAIVGLATLLAAALILGYLDKLLLPIRFFVAVVAWLLVMASAARFLRPALRRWTVRRAALLIEHQKPELEERLSSAVELAGEKDPRFRGSPALIEHLLRQAEADVAGVHPDQIVRTDRIVRWTLALAPVVLAWLLAVLMPATTRTAITGLYRLLMPWRNTLPAALTQTPAKPGDVALPARPRPQITGIDLRYDFPAYTDLAPRAESGKDGSVEALVGTRVTVTIRTAQPVVAAKSNIIFDEKTPEQLMQPLKPARSGASEYTAEIVISHSGQYKVRLTNGYDLTNEGEQPRSIVAIADEAPTIVIQSPQSQVTVRPDDTAPVKYLATDDFGISAIEAIVQVDDHAPQTLPVKFKAVDRRNVTGPAFALSVADAIKTAGVAEADHITYQLKATDNRDPDPQFSFSARQTLKIDKNEWQSFQSKMEQKVAADLTQAIRKAMEDLDRNKPRVERIRDRGPRDAIEDWNRNELHLATTELPRSARELDKAADEAADTVFEDVVRKMKMITDGPLRAAADDATQADLNLDNGLERKSAAEKSVKEIVKARDALKKLLEPDEVRRAQEASEAARDLAEAAKKQNEAAELMKPPDLARDDPQAQETQNQAMQKQNEASQKLQQAISKTQSLQDPKAQETAGKLQELIRKVEDLEKQQADELEQNHQPLDESARQRQQQLADQTRDAERQARELQGQAHATHNQNVANRARRAQAELAKAQHHESAAARAEQESAHPQQEQARDALARAESALRGLPRQLARAQDEPPEGPDAGAKEHAGDDMKRASQEAAGAAQEATQAQQEASQQNPAAADEAARALSRAATAMADAVSKSMRPGNDNGQAEDGEQAEDTGKASPERSTQPGQAPDPKEGISVTAADAGAVPAAVRDVGITPDQWAKLPPMARKDLLNAAQQSGPPAYRQMIKDYYVKVARMLDSSASGRQ